MPTWAFAAFYVLAVLLVGDRAMGFFPQWPLTAFPYCNKSRRCSVSDIRPRQSTHQVMTTAPTHKLSMGDDSTGRTSETDTIHSVPSTESQESPISQELYVVDDATLDLIHSFLSQVQTSINENTFLAFSLKGPTRPKSSEDALRIRGCIRLITGRPIVLQSKQPSKRISSSSTSTPIRRAIQVTFKYHGATDICKNWDMDGCASKLKSILLSSKATEGSNGDGDIDGAYVPPSEWNDKLPIVTTWGHSLGVQSATLQTTKGTEWNLAIAKRSIKNNALLKTRTTQLVQRKMTSISPALSSANPEDLQQHDRAHQGPVNVSAPVWQALGVTTLTKNNKVPKVVPKANMASKLRQCQKFVEIVHRLTQEAATELQHTTWDRISVVDMGCGRGYLTFALHSFLYQTYQRTSNVIVSSRGIDVRPKLVQEISSIAASLGDEFQNLQFETGAIESYLAESTTSEQTKDDHDPATNGKKTALDVFIALHACDTATDDALWSALSRQADIIVVAPCCHQQVRPQLNAAAAAASRNHPYADVLRHNIYRERVSETVTDSLRALLLELDGTYSVQVFEFIGGEHTSKNVMITAVKKRANNRHDTAMNSAPDTRDVDKKEQHYSGRLERIRSLANLHGIRNQKLAEFMGVTLWDESDTTKKKEYSSRTMPPIRTKNL